MARRGTVVVEVAPRAWRRLTVFDDGWVELVAPPPTALHFRRNVPAVLVAAWVFLLATAAVAGLRAVGAPAWTREASVAVAVAALFSGAYLAGRRHTDDSGDDPADTAEDRAARAASQRLRLAPGAPRWRRAESAAQFHSWLVGVPLVDGAEIVEVVTTPAGEGDTHRAVVRMRDGTTRSYASPDERLVSLVGGFAPG